MDNTTKRNFSNLRVLSWNIASFAQRKATLARYAALNDIDVICLQETLAKTACVKVPGYKAFSVLSKEGIRGVTTLVRETTKCCRVKPPKLATHTEAVTVALTLQNETIVITNVYHHNGEQALDIGKFMRKSPNKHLIVGDFNCHHSLWGRYNLDTKVGGNF